MLGLLRRDLRQSEPGIRREPFDSLREGKALRRHDEIENIAVIAGRKTMVKAFSGH